MAVKKKVKKLVKKTKKPVKKPSVKRKSRVVKKAAPTSIDQRLNRMESLLEKLVGQKHTAAPVSAASTLDSYSLEMLSRLPLFSRLNSAEIALAAQRLQEVQMPASELLFAEGDEGDSMYVVVSGSLEIFRQDVLGDRQIAVIRPGAMVGEMALIEGKPRSANVRAHEDSQLVEVSKAAFENIKREMPEIATKLQDELLHLISGRLRDTTEQLLAAKTIADQQKGRGKGL